MSPSNRGSNPGGLFIGEAETLSGLSDNVHTMSKNSFAKSVMGTVKEPIGSNGTRSSQIEKSTRAQKSRRSRTLSYPDEVFRGVADDGKQLLKDEDLARDVGRYGDGGVVLTSQSFAESTA